ncbi:MAG: PAS domain S-box protein [Deltaproteobacteria bacterium]|nr:PAS domain S-box protein [Deltaproteobacteria bacterium]MBI3386710.1 PAS domain S-box protein [Deltaproteobacteria bacterium]
MNVRSHRSLLARLLAPYLIALLAVAASLYAYGDRVIERLYLDTLAAGVAREAELAGELLPWNLRGEAMDRQCAAVAVKAKARVTIIAPDGTVLGDSEAPSATLENHHDRPEVRAALADGDGQAVRVSASVKQPLFYRAWRQTLGDAPDSQQRIVRLSVPIATIDDARHRIRAAIWSSVAVAALAALALTLTASRRLSARVGRLTEFSTAVAAGETAPPLRPEADDIIGQLEANLLAMANSLRAQLHGARTEQAKLAAVLSGMVEGVLVIDRGGVIQLANQRAEEVFGNSTLLGQHLINVSRDPDLQELARAIMAGPADQHLTREIALNGARQEYLQVTATSIVTADGLPNLFILVFHDVTEMKKLESARRDFVANVSHELRTPLTAIRGYAETLQAGAIDNPDLARKFVGVIERHSERLSRLTDDLLTLSDLELGRTELQRLAMPLAPTVTAAIDAVAKKAADGKVELRSDVAADLPLVSADPDRIEQVLVNLIDNAVKYTLAGDSVTVSAYPVADSQTVEVCVRDAGVGIPSQDLPRLTERFYRVDKARSRELGGTGLGLAIVKHIVQAHGGTLRIESELGVGTSVFIALPVAEDGDGSSCA